MIGDNPSTYKSDMHSADKIGMAMAMSRVHENTMLLRLHAVIVADDDEDDEDGSSFSGRGPAHVADEEHIG